MTTKEKIENWTSSKWKTFMHQKTLSSDTREDGKIASTRNSSPPRQHLHWQKWSGNYFRILESILGLAASKGRLVEQILVNFSQFKLLAGGYVSQLHGRQHVNLFLEYIACDLWEPGWEIRTLSFKYQESVFWSPVATSDCGSVDIGAGHHC